MALAAVVSFVASTKSKSSAAYSTEAIRVMRFKPNPSRRVNKATVIAARNERPNESSRPESVVHLMKRPPVLQMIAAARTSKRGEAEGLARELGKLVIGQMVDLIHRPRRRDCDVVN